MADETARPSPKLSPEFWAIVAVGVAVLGQAVWLDGKIERGDARLEANLSPKIEDLRKGQAAIRERLAMVEGYLSRSDEAPFPGSIPPQPQG